MPPLQELFGAGSLRKRSFVQPESRPPPLLTHGATFATMCYEKQRYSSDLMDQGDP